MRILFTIFLSLFLFHNCGQQHIYNEETKNDNSRFLLKQSDLANGAHHTRHASIYGKSVTGYNLAILHGIDKVQSMSDSGGGYFIGIKAVPTESPVGYELSILGKSLLDPPRTTSYCSGSSYAAFVEGLNLILENQSAKMDYLHYESMRMQEEDGGRREDHIKFWGEWNADGYGNHFALVQYSGMGRRIKPIEARPGDFMNISWKSGNGHSVIFLGWYSDEQNQKKVAFWSSQRSTNGYGDLVVNIDKISEIMVVRLANPYKVFDFNLDNKINLDIRGDKIIW